MKNNLCLLAVLSSVAAFGGVLDNAWLRGTTSKDPLTYRVGEKIVFTLAAG